jgi:hypothetical protein
MRKSHRPCADFTAAVRRRAGEATLSGKIARFAGSGAQAHDFRDFKDLGGEGN